MQSSAFQRGDVAKHGKARLSIGRARLLPSRFGFDKAQAQQELRPPDSPTLSLREAGLLF